MADEETELNDLTEFSDLSFQEILNNLLDGDENLDLKTRIYKPKKLAALKIVGEFIEMIKWLKSSTLLFSFLEYYLRNMVSFKGLSREEIIRALTTHVQLDSETKSKLMENMS